MKKLAILFLSIVSVIAMSAQEIQFDTEKSEVKWTGKKVTGEHWGFVNLKSGKLDLKNNKIESGKFVIDMTSITDEDLEPGEWHDKLIGHLKSDDFFSVEKYKEAVLVIKGSTAFSNGEADVNGDLTIKGITHPITFKAVKTDNDYKAQIVVDRTNYDIRFRSKKFFENLGDNLIYDDFTLDVTVVSK